MKDFSVNLKPENAQYLFLKHRDIVSNVDWREIFRRRCLGEVRLVTKNRAAWACEHGQITKIRLSDGRGGKTIPMTVKVGNCRSRFDGYAGNVSQ